MTQLKAVFTILSVAMFANLMFGLVGYFGVLANNNTVSALGSFTQFESSINTTSAQMSNSANISFSSSEGALTQIGAFLGVIWYALVLAVQYILMIIDIFVVVLPSLIYYGFGGTLGGILSIVSITVTLGSVIYLAYSIKEWIPQLNASSSGDN